MILSFLSFLLLTSAGAAPAIDSLSSQAGYAATTASPEPARPALREWTVMVYMNGKSNIEPYALEDLNRFETVGSSDKVAIIAEIGRSKGLDNDTAADGDWDGVRRYFVTKDQDKDHIASTLISDLGSPDMGDWKQAASFLKWARSAYPAKKYLFVIWDHGWGWIDPKKPGEKPADAAKSISHDFVTGNYIKTTEMGKIFREAGRVDMYVSMACFMQMAEVAYELKDSAEIIVGSEEIIQLPSLNWEDFLSLLTKNPGTKAEAAGIYMTDTFREMYGRPEYLDMLEKTKYGVQLSALRAAKLPQFAGKAKAWHSLAMAADDKKALIRAKAEVLRFEVGDETTDPDKSISFYGDLYNFTELAGRYADPARPGAAAAEAAGKDLRDFITKELIVKNVWLGKDRTGKEYSSTRGLGIQIPGKPGNLIEYYPAYSELAFEKATGWDTFVKYLESLGK
ncbi:MAG: hypothetical protein COX65_00170 [Elusimicrobia bacterium CG_4_10_14_0_2_um_filter_56_8]|nr:MAG: hypothetical protein AUJ51_12485 [Elusimicrobia bacterium CG1_02_56_21]PJA17985.1 MAG: hypothetical protein COX65_00170 [Elusimicrobia bacterium CG_4_10_14_0_2_um_filter_56_8]